MSTNYLQQNPQQAWSWETAMDPHHHHHHHHRFFQPDHSAGGGEREHMFEKPLTPSDVGKLNRLVIPKQHAEKYFPIARESGEKGLLLNFEDETGKEWHFRYSYWTSSQSYVLTKGWSRFVKEKRLDAGDIVLFQRRRGDHLLYIGCRRRGGDSQAAAVPSSVGPSAVLPWNQANYTTSIPSTSCFYANSMQQDCHTHAGSPTESSTAKPRRLRLFGVNLECGPEQ